MQKSSLNLAGAAGLEVEIKFYHQHNLKPRDYIQVSSVNIPDDHRKLNNNQKDIIEIDQLVQNISTK